MAVVFFVDTRDLEILMLTFVFVGTPLTTLMLEMHINLYHIYVL